MGARDPSIAHMKVSFPLLRQECTALVERLAHWRSVIMMLILVAGVPPRSLQISRCSLESWTRFMCRPSLGNMCSVGDWMLTRRHRSGELVRISQLQSLATKSQRSLSRDIQVAKLAAKLREE